MGFVLLRRSTSLGVNAFQTAKTKHSAGTPKDVQRAKMGFSGIIVSRSVLVVLHA